MEDSDSIKSIYIDTNVIRGSGERFTKLLVASKRKLLKVYISEVVLWERSKQESELHQKSNFPRYNFGIFFDSLYFKKILEDNQVIIIEHDDSIIQQADTILNDPTNSFKLTDYNDIRDGHILAAAKVKLSTEVHILCEEKKLLERFRNLASFQKFIIMEDLISGLSISNKDVQELQQQKPKTESVEINDNSQPYSNSLLSILPRIDPDHYQKYLLSTESYNRQLVRENKTHLPNQQLTPSLTDNALDEKLRYMQVMDTEIRKRVLGYTHCFSPAATKSDLHQLLLSKNYKPEEIEFHAKRLKQEQLLIETENHWLTNTQNAEARKICEQAMTVVMPEILEIMELS